MEKVSKSDLESLDISSQNLGFLAKHFPSAVTESGIDFEELKGLLGGDFKDKGEKYGLSWNGKHKAKQIAQTPSSATLLPSKSESINFDSTKNVFIEGDNLEVLKVLQKSYYGKVKMIYIDPPYNTGGDFVYPDNFHDSIGNYLELTGQVDHKGNQMSTNSETSGRYHTDWLNMMYPRIKLARNLLTDDGVIFISIDDNEVANLRKVCDEIFGEENYYASFVWQRRSGAMDSVDNVSLDHEYIVCYGKIKGKLRGIKRSFDKYTNPDNDPRGPWISDNLSAGKPGGDVHYPITDPITGNKYYPPEGRYWPYNRETMQKKISEGRVLFPKKIDGRPMLKRFKNEAKSKYVPASTLMRKKGESKVSNALFSTLNTYGTKEVQQLLGGKLFSHPKSTVLIDSLASQVLNGDSDEIILDFFAGSCTSAHSVLKLNADDGGNRRFIVVQLPEPCDEKSLAYKAGFKTIADIGKERIRLVLKQIKSEQKSQAHVKGTLPGLTEEPPQLDLGFKVFKLDSTNIKPWDADFDNYESSMDKHIINIKPDRSEEDVLYEILLKYGLDLTLPIEERTIADKKVFIVGLGALVLCLANGITLDVVEGIAKLKSELAPEVMRVVFKDNGFKNDVVKTNTIQILRQHGITDVKSL